MKTKEQIQNRIKELQQEFKEINEKYSPYSSGSDISNRLNSIEVEIETLKWVISAK